MSNISRIFFVEEEDMPTAVVQQLAEKPESLARRSAVESAIAIQLEDHPELEAKLRLLFDKIKQTDEGAKVINNITNSKNITTGANYGTFHQGDNINTKP